ncbi:MAG: hypothetical protein MJ225_04450 [Bacilli bacterium]|nr:hypothetical protein [Bacilli bacterium]
MQNESLKLKRILETVFTVSLVFIVIFLCGYILSALFLDKETFSDRLLDTLKTVKAAYVYPFKKDNADVVTALASYKTDGQFLAICISTYVVTGIALVMLALGITNCVIKKKAKFTWFAIQIVVVLFVSVILLTQVKNYFEAVFKGVQSIRASDGNMVALDLTLFAYNPTMVRTMNGLALFGGLFAVISTVATYVLGLIYINKNEEAVEQLDFTSEEPVLAEEAVVPQAVQESSEIPEEEVAVEQVEAEPEPEEPKEEPAPAVEEKKAEPAIDQNNLASLLREVVRDIVRDELARNNANQPNVQQTPASSTQQITGATFGGPLVVQYFNGGINGVTQPTAAPAPVEAAPAPAPAPVAEEVKPVEAPKAEAKVEPKPAPVAAPAPKAEEPKEEKVYERLSFGERLLQSDKELQNLYNELKNEILSYGVKSRVSANGDTFRLHKKQYIKITVAGKSLKLYFALDPKDYANSTIPVQDASGKSLYEEIPLCFKVKSGLSVRRCKELIQATMDKDGLEQGEVLKVNWIKELKAEIAAGKKD